MPSEYLAWSAVVLLAGVGIRAIVRRCHVGVWVRTPRIDARFIVRPTPAALESDGDAAPRKP